MGGPLGAFRQDIRFNIDYNIPSPPNFTGYVMQDMLVRIRGWYDPENHTRPDNNDLYGILIDIEDGDKRMTSDAEMTYKDIFSSQEQKDQQEQKRFEDEFKVKGKPLRNQIYGDCLSGMYCLMIPTTKNVGDAGVTPDDIKAEQEELIKQYVNAMRKEWKKLYDQVCFLKGDYNSEFDKIHKSIEADEPYGRFEMVRSFMTNTINGKTTEVFHYKSMLEWLLEKKNVCSCEQDVRKTLKQLTVPFMEGATYQIQMDWAIPYIVFHPTLSAGKLGHREMGTTDESNYYPFHNFLSERNYDGMTEITITKSSSTVSPIYLNPTGFAYFVIVTRILANINFLSQQNLNAVMDYHDYVFRLELVKQAMMGGPPFKSGPFKDQSKTEIKESIEKAKKEYGIAKWNDLMKDKLGDLFRDKVEEGSKGQEHLNQLLLGIHDIENLQDFFRSVAEKETTEHGGINKRRMASLEAHYHTLEELMKSPKWKSAHEDLWMWNRDIFGPILYVSMAELLVAQSSEGDSIYNRLHKKLVFENAALEKSREEWEKSEIAADGSAHVCDNWYLLFPGFICLIFEAHFERYAKEVINKAGGNFAEGARALRKPIKKIITHLIPKFESNLAKLDLHLEDLSRQILQVEGIEDLRQGRASSSQKINIKNRTRAILNKTMAEVTPELQTMQANVKGQAALHGVGILLNMYAFMMFGAYKMNAGEAGDIGNWKFEEFTGIGTQLVALGDDVLALGKTTNLIKVIPGSTATKTLLTVSRFAALLGIIQSSIQAITSGASEDWKNMFLNSAAAVGGLMMIGAGMIKSGTILTASVIGAKIGIILLVVGGILLLASAVIQFFSLWENQTEKLCRTVLIEDKDDGGCEKFARYKKDFEYGESNTVRGLTYDTAKFGSDVNQIDHMVERVINFVNDYDTYDLY